MDVVADLPADPQRRNPWIQAFVRSTTQRTTPRPEPCGVPRRAMTGLVDLEFTVRSTQRARFHFFGRGGRAALQGRITAQQPGSCRASAVGSPTMEETFDYLWVPSWRCAAWAAPTCDG